MTREEYQKIIMEDRKSRNVYGQSLQTNKNNSSVGIAKVPNNKIETQKVGAEQYNSAPINIAEPKKLVQDNASKIDTWLDSSYKLSKDEKKEAEAYVKQWRKENNAFKNNPYKTQEGTRELQKIAELESKLSKGTAAWSGFMNSIPFLNNIQDKVTDSINDKNTKDVVDKQRQILEASEAQNPGAALAGNLAGEIAKYSAGTELLKGAGIIGDGGKITNGVSKVIKNPKVAGSVANILGDTALDIALDTIPQLAKDISNGDEKAGANALKNVGTNLAFNTLGEGVGIVGGKVIGKLADKKQLGKATSLNPLEEHVKAAEEIVKDTDDLQKQVLESSQNLTDQIQKQKTARVNNSAENVAGITDYKKVSISNHDEMSKNIDKFIGMYGDDAAKTKALEYKQSINNFLENYSEEAWEEVANNANELDRMLQGKTYTYKNQGKAKNKSNVRQAKYDKEIRDILTYETDNLIKEAEENAFKKSNVVKESVSTPIVKTSDDTIEKEMAKSRYASETVVNKTDIPDEVKNEFRENPKMYEVLKNKDTDARANEIFENSDFNTAYAEFDRLLEDRDPVSIPLGYKLAKQLAESGATQQAVDIVDKMSERLTKAGQFTQSAAITMLQGDPMASMRYMQKQLQKMNVTGAEHYKNWKKLELTEDEVKAFSNIEPQDKDAIMELYSKIEDRLAKEYPSSTWEKVVELSKTSMMLHSRTHIRNIASNAIMVPVRSLSDRVSALGQNAVKLFKPDLEVTQSLTGGTSAQKKIANQIFDNQIKPLLDDSGKWNNVSGNVPKNKQVFKDSKIGAAAKKGFVWSASQANNLTGGKLESLVNTLDKSMTDSVLENLRKFDYWLLGEVEDNPFVKKNFSNRLASYMKAQNITDIDAVPNEAVQIAYQEALKATFKDDNTMTKAFSNLKGLFGKFGEVAMPFTKTPANIAMRGLDYSPAGIVNAIKQAKNGDDIGRVIDTVAKSATGTAGILLGYKLAENGLIQGALSSDTDKQQFEKQQGKVAYSIKVGDNYISFDFAQPAAIPIIIGTTIHDSVKESDMDAEKLFNTAYQATGAAFNSWLELSPLQSLQDMLGGSGYGENNVFENIANETLEFPQRLIPSMLGASARTVDPVYRQTYSKGNVLQTQIDTAKAKIPGLSEQLPISYDTWGNPRRRQDNTVSAAIANFINPGTLGYDASTPIDGEIERLFESTQSNSVFPQKASWSVKNKKGDTIELTNEQYSRYQKEMGQTSYSIAETVINSDYYNNLPDEDKAECLSLIYSISKADTNNKMFGTKVADKTKKYVDVYNMNGPEGLVNYLQQKHDFDSLDVDMSGKKAQEAYKNGGKEGLEEFATFKNTAETLGLSINSEAVNKVYETGGIPYLKQYSTYKTKADKDGNGRLKKEEVASYLNASGLSQEEKRYWFSVLYTGTAKNPY